MLDKVFSYKSQMSVTGERIVGMMSEESGYGQKWALIGARELRSIRGTGAAMCKPTSAQANNRARNRILTIFGNVSPERVVEFDASAHGLLDERVLRLSPEGGVAAQEDVGYDPKGK